MNIFIMYGIRKSGRHFIQPVYPERRIPKVVLPKYQRLGRYPALAGAGKCSGFISIYCRFISAETRNEDPTRMFAGGARKNQ